MPYLSNLKSKFIIFTILCLLPITIQAKGLDIWFEPSVGWLGVNLDVKMGKGNKAWALGYSTYKPNGLTSAEKSTIYESINRRAKTVVSEISIMHYVRKSMRMGYFDAGIGLGKMEGENYHCEDGRCSVDDYAVLSVPVEANMVFGRYAGIGLTARVSFSEKEVGYLLGVSIPIGRF